jgi:hypothetical protein
MPYLSDDELKARSCLKVGDILVDPKYLHPRETAEQKLKDRCRACWKLREFFPSWVHAYIERWAKEKQPVMSKADEDWAA